MTIDSIDVSSGPYSGTGATDSFSYDFPITSKSELLVYFTSTSGVQSILTVDSDYTVTGVGDSDGGSITLTSGNLATGESLFIRSNRIATQGTDFDSQGSFFPDTHEAAFDKLTMLVQQLADRVMLAPGGLYRPPALNELPVASAGQVLIWDTNGALINTDLSSVIGSETLPVFNSVALALATDLDGVDTVRTLAFYGGWSGSTSPLGGAVYYRDGTTGSASTLYADNSGFYDATGAGYALIKNQPIDVCMFGAVGDGVTDDTAAFAAARDFAAFILVPVPPVAYVVTGLHPGNRKYWRGAGVRQNGSVIRCSTANRGIFEFTALAESTFDGLNFEATELGCAAFKDTASFSDYMQNCDVINCQFFNSLRYGVYANLILNNFDRCHFMQFGTDLGQDRTAIYAQFSGGAKTLNINNWRNCNFYNCKGGAVVLQRGFLAAFELCTFETLEDEAIRALGVDNIYLLNCWLENIDDADHFIDLQLSTVGCNIWLENCKFDNNSAGSTATRIVSLDSACAAGFNRCSGNMGGAYLTEKFGVSDSGLLESRNNSLTNYPGIAGDLLLPSRLVVDNYWEPVFIRTTGLSDSPGAPETVATFTIPSAPSGQNTFMAVIELHALVSAVATTTSVQAQNHQDLVVAVFRDAAGIDASIVNTPTSTDNVNGGGFWSSQPVWSVAVSGSNVLLQMTSNPGGGGYSGGITAIVSGTIVNADSSNASKRVTK